MNQNDFSAYQRYLAFQKFWHAFNKWCLILYDCKTSNFTKVTFQLYWAASGRHNYLGLSDRNHCQDGDRDSAGKSPRPHRDQQTISWLLWLLADQQMARCCPAQFCSVIIKYLTAALSRGSVTVILIFIVIGAFSMVIKCFLFLHEKWYVCFMISISMLYE